MELYLNWVRVTIFHAMAVDGRNGRQVKLRLLVICVLFARVRRG